MDEKLEEESFKFDNLCCKCVVNINEPEEEYMKEVIFSKNKLNNKGGKYNMYFRKNNN
jgi:hypothetical protein